LSKDKCNPTIGSSPTVKCINDKAVLITD